MLSWESYRFVLQNIQSSCRNYGSRNGLAWFILQYSNWPSFNIINNVLAKYKSWNWYESRSPQGHSYTSFLHQWSILNNWFSTKFLTVRFLLFESSISRVLYARASKYIAGCSLLQWKTHKLCDAGLQEDRFFRIQYFREKNRV